MYKSSSLNSLTHGFFTRKGGVSRGVYDSLNFIVNRGDSMENVRRNREIAMDTLGVPDRVLVTANQVHGTHAVVVKEPWGHNQGVTPEADILITQNPEVVLGIFTADCVPVLIYDEVTGTVAAVHSGWKGTQQNVVGVALGHMQDLGVHAGNVKAVLGPSIAQDNYEVGAEVYEGFVSQNFSYAAYFKPSVNENKFMLDVPGAVEMQLKAAGVGHVEILGLDTYALEEEFFSCRRAFHRGEEGFGCMLSAIGL